MCAECHLQDWAQRRHCGQCGDCLAVPVDHVHAFVSLPGAETQSGEDLLFKGQKWEHMAL